jgi:hypothetical protein
MTPAVSFMVRHALGVAAAAVAILPMPYLTSRVSWGLSSLFRESGGMEIYSPSWSSPDLASVFGTLAVIGLLCVAGDSLRGRFRWLSWGFPCVVALLLGVSLGVAMASGGVPGDFPAYAPLVVGITFTMIGGLLLGAYWVAMLLAAQVCGP